MPPGYLETELAPKVKPQREQKVRMLLPSCSHGSMQRTQVMGGWAARGLSLLIFIHCILVLSSVIEAKRTAGKLLFCVSYTVFRTQAQKSTPSANRLLVGTSGE